MASYVAVKLYGPGHVVAYNYIADFHDGINVETYGNPDGSYASGPGIVEGPKYPTREYWDRRPVAIDFYNNYITNSHDNPIEADGSMHNIRIMRNMLINHASHAFCNQPTLGGPVYWIRNIAYNLPGGSTRLTNGAAGAIFYNNTILSETQVQGASNIHWRNNLMLGQNSAPAILSVNTFTSYTSSDYNGFRLNPGAKAAFQWNSPPRRRSRDFTGPGHNAGLESRSFTSLADYSQGDGAGRAQRRRRLRRLRQRAASRCAGHAERAEAVQGRRLRLPHQARIGRRRSRRRAADRHRRLRRQRARSRRARSRASRCRTTVPGDSSLVERRLQPARTNHA